MVDGIINVQPTISGALANVTVGPIATLVDAVSHFLGRSFLLELVAADLDSSGKEKQTIKAHASSSGLNDDSNMYEYKCEFEIPEEFGEIGAVLVQNEHHKEAYVKNIVLNDGNFPSLEIATQLGMLFGLASNLDHGLSRIRRGGGGLGVEPSNRKEGTRGGRVGVVPGGGVPGMRNRGVRLEGT
ncbi:hypothetical protein L6452_24054 [Arctium lappa]|uniref:Uncharacterized protein n=1 Tax=Arctium lappa TaxID=4217 RepID=A0ACB9AAI8_ARCLA|nr:hypothetical protein L6452_24054 [Arctium lappa]